MDMTSKMRIERENESDELKNARKVVKDSQNIIGREFTPMEEARLQAARIILKAYMVQRALIKRAM